MKKILTTTVLSFGLLLSNLVAQDFANISYGSNPTPGSALFLGIDAAAADSISIGYFSGTANALGTGYTTLDTSTSFNSNVTGFNGPTTSNTDVTSSSGKDAWIQVVDGSLFGFINMSDWASISGAPAGNTPTPLDYTIVGVNNNNLSTFGLDVTEGGGFQGSGYSFKLAAVVPEPSTYALLVGALALGFVAIRRRK